MSISPGAQLGRLGAGKFSSRFHPRSTTLRAPAPVLRFPSLRSRIALTRARRWLWISFEMAPVRRRELDIPRDVAAGLAAHFFRNSSRKGAKAQSLKPRLGRSGSSLNCS